MLAEYYRVPVQLDMVTIEFDGAGETHRVELENDFEFPINITTNLLFREFLEILATTGALQSSFNWYWF